MGDCGTQRAFYILEEHRYLNTYLDFHPGTRGNAHQVKPVQEMPSGGPQLLAPGLGSAPPCESFSPSSASVRTEVSGSLRVLLVGPLSARSYPRSAPETPSSERFHFIPGNIPSPTGPPGLLL